MPTEPHWDQSDCLCAAPAEPDREERHHHSEHRINKILSEVNKSAEKFPGLSEPHHHQHHHQPQLAPHHPALLLPNNTEDLKLAALSFYQNELSQLGKLPGGLTQGDQSEEDHQVWPGQRERIIFHRKTFSA